MKVRFWSLALGMLLLGSVTDARAELAKKDRKEAKSMLSGTLYLRIDVPCGTGRHPYGTYMVPLVEVSPEGVNTDGEMGFTGGAFHAQSTYWGVGPNDTVEFDEMEFEDDTAEIELTGVGPTDGNDTVVKFVNINSLDDFKKAFDLTFARKPLQDEHPDWPEDVRKAIGERKLMKGMTKRQVFYVTGAPEEVNERGEGSKKEEVWMLRQNRGMQIGFWTMSTSSPSAGSPKTLRFVDGKLVDFDASGKGGVNLDD